jgi:hypothetical protein
MAYYEINPKKELFITFFNNDVRFFIRIDFKSKKGKENNAKNSKKEKEKCLFGLIDKQASNLSKR